MKKRTLIVGILCCALVLLCYATAPPVHAQGGTKSVTGKITSMNYGMWVPFFGRRVIMVVQDSRGQDLTLHGGRRTVYIPRRAPILGDKVTVEFYKANDVWAAGLVKFE